MEPIPQHSRSLGRLAQHQQARQPTPAQLSQNGGHLIINQSQASPLRAKSPLDLNQQFQPVDSSEFRRSQALLRQIREKEAQFLAQNQHSNRPQQTDQKSALSMSQLLKQSINDTNIDHNSSIQHGVSFEVGQHLAADQQHQDPLEQSRAYSQLSSVYGGRRSTSPLRNATQKQIISQLSQQPHESLQSQPSVMDLPMPSLDIQQMRYAEKLINDNQKLEQKFQQAQNQLQKVNNETNQLSQYHGDVYQKNTQQQIDLQNIDKPQNLSEQEHDLAGLKNQNMYLTSNIHTTDRVRVDLLKKLRFLQQRREFTHTDFEDKKLDVQTKLQIIKETEAQRVFNTQKLDRVQRQIQALQVNLLSENRVVHDSQQLIDQLMGERDELMDKLVQLNQTYQQTVNDTQKENELAQEHSKRQRQILAGKAMFNVLGSLQKSRQQAAVNDFFFYCQFDERCHRSLSQLSRALEKCGRLRMSIVIKRWYQNTFEPISTISQIDSISDKFYQMKIMGQCWAQWCAESHKKKQNLKNAHIACLKLWKLGNQDKFNSMKRSFKIWRGEDRISLQRQHIVKRILLRQYDQVRRQAFYILAERSIQHHWLARQQSLLTQQAQKQYKLQILMKLKESVLLQRDKKHRKLKLLFKAWKDGLAYHKYMMAQNLQAARLRRQANKRLMCQVFCELRLSKELEKYVLMHTNLTLKLTPQLIRLNNEFLEIAAKSLRQRKIRALKCLARNSCVGAAGYFNKWKMINQSFKSFTGSWLRSFMTRQYRALTHQAMLRWRNGLRWRKLKALEQQAYDLQMSEDELKERLRSLKKGINDEKYRQEATRQRALSGCIKVFNRRMQQYGMNRWSRDIKRRMGNLTRGQIAINQKYKYLMKSVMELWREKFGLQRLRVRQTWRELYYQELRESRLKKKVYKALITYTDNFRRARRYWQIVFTHVDCWVKRRTMVRWTERVNQLAIHDKKETQNNNTIWFDNKNVALGRQVKDLTEKTEENKDLKKALMAIAQRVLSNAFARYYYVKAERGIKRWRDRVAFEKHRELLLKRWCLHQKQHRHYYVKAGFQNWISNCKIKENKGSIKHTEQLTEDQIQLNLNLDQNHKKFKLDIEKEIKLNEESNLELQNKENKCLQMITRKNEDCNYQSQLRFIFQQWVSYYRRQKRFCLSVRNALQKSMWQTGFTAILESSKKQRLGSLQKVHGIGMVRMYSKKKLGRAFNQWREQRYEAVVHSTNNTLKVIDEISGGHTQFRQKVSDFNSERAANIIRQRKLANFLKAWQNTHKWLMTSKAQTKALQDQVLIYRSKRATLHWHTLAHNSIKRKYQNDKFKHRQGLIYKRMTFDALKAVQTNDRSFYEVLGHIASKFDTKMKQCGLHMIKNFRASRDISDEQSKKAGMVKMTVSLEFLFQRRMALYLSDLRSKKLEESITIKRIVGCIKYWNSRRTRAMFMKWKQSAGKETTVNDVNDDGPLVEEVLMHKLRLKNMADFMRDQKYTKSQVDEAVNFSSTRVKDLMGKALARLRHASKDKSDDKYLKPICFDRWRQYVKLRKLLKYIMRNVENSLAPNRADLSVAFNRWRKQHNESYVRHAGQDRIKLVVKAAHLDQRLKAMDELGADKNQQIIDNRHERDDLFDGYVRGQRLGIALGRDNHDRSKQKAFEKLMDRSARIKQEYMENLLQKNIDLIGKMKDRCLQLEAENNVLSGDNEVLRQSSLDGFDIAKGAQQLSDDREQLSIDLADKAVVIKNLLQQNEALQRQMAAMQQQRQ